MHFKSKNMIKNTIMILVLTVAGSMTGGCAVKPDSRQSSAGNPVGVENAEDNSVKVSILGDSYSTFEGWIPEGYIAWYKPVPKPGRPTDVTDVSQTWWMEYIRDRGYELEINNSYSGSTVSNTGYEGRDYSDQSFVSRVGLLGNPDLIFVFGGTNDSWAGSPLGEYIWDGWTSQDLYYYRPALAYTASHLQELYPGAGVVFIINDDISDDVKQSTVEVCEYYGIPYVQLEDIDKISAHPSAKGMRQIKEQIENRLWQKQP